MGDLNQRDPGIIQCSSESNHLQDADLVSLGVHAIAQAHIVEQNLSAFKMTHHTSSA
ncbi:hypothetical protein D3C71_2165150 [compost metagenome]